MQIARALDPAVQERAAGAARATTDLADDAMFDVSVDPVCVLGRITRSKPRVKH